MCRNELKEFERKHDHELTFEKGELEKLQATFKEEMILKDERTQQCLSENDNLHDSSIQVNILKHYPLCVKNRPV